MERIGVRELRNYASRVVRRARAGERLLITVDGVPAAEIGPVSREGAQTIEELVAAGLLIAPRRTDPPPPPAPIAAPVGRSSKEVLTEHREQR